MEESLKITNTSGQVGYYSSPIPETQTPSICDIPCPTTQPKIGDTSQEKFGYTDPESNEFIRYDSGERVVEVFDKLLCKLEVKLKSMKEDNLLSDDVSTRVLVESMGPMLNASVQFSLGMHTAANANVQAEIARVTAQTQIDTVMYERNLASVNVAAGIENIRQTQLNGVKDRESKVISDTLRQAQTQLFNTQRDGIIHKSKVDVLSNISDIWTITAVEEPASVYQVSDLMTNINSAISELGSGIANNTTTTSNAQETIINE